MRAVLVALLMSGVIALPAPAQTQAAANPAMSSEALALAELVSPEELYLAREMDTARRSFMGGLERDPKMAALEGDHPGLSKAMWSSVELEFRRYLAELLPEYRSILAGIYQRRLSASEMRAVRTFYATATGKKMIRAMYMPVDVEPLIDDFANDPDAKISGKTISALNREARANAVSVVTPNDAPALTALAEGVSVAKMRTIGTDIQQAMLTWINKSDPAFDARIEELMTAGVERFLAREAGQ